ncbi:bifunctional (p)ppGpp synthetase/guanosine-3',5'-bis(diphosphate) 3'-pyrophosphohydrolase [bacterium]|nr:bifunctional (p)ppGpp synthetase/guanosine-3',5'-bis(diphosphate) 3'-pyrophosphohydrolase [bacterium]
MSSLQEAVNFAIAAHKGQVRKYDGSAYIMHPFSVMGMMTEFTADWEELAAAILHDTVEDCDDVTIEAIHERFGERVASIVFYATEVSQKTDGNRATRKAMDRRHYSAGPGESQDLKGVDMIDNIPTIVLMDPEFAGRYLEEKLLLLAVLTKMNPIIKERAERLIQNMYKILG